MAKRPATSLPTRVEKRGEESAPPTRVQNAVVAVDLVATMPAPLAQYVSAAIAEIGAIAGDEEALWRASDAGDRMEMAGRLIAGRANLELQQLVPPRQLAEELRRRNKPRANFDYQVRVYKAFEPLPDLDKVEALGALGFTKCRALLPLEPEERLALASGAEVRGLTIETAADLPTRDFEKALKPKPAVPPEVRDYERQLAETQTQLKLARQQIDRRKNLRDETGLPPAVREAREETAVECAQLGLAIDNLEILANDFLFKQDIGADALLLRPVVATAYVHALGSQLVRGLQLLMNVRMKLGKNINTALHDDHLLDLESLKQYQGALDLIVSGNQEARKKRDNDRANTQAGRKGRKRGS